MKRNYSSAVDVMTLSGVIQSWDKSSFGLLTGNAEIYHLAHVWIAVLIARGFRVHVIDCAIRFNVYRVIEEANSQGVELQSFLDTGVVRRAFTPYQILDVCREILTTKRNPNDIYFILAPSKQFFDGDVKEAEGYFLLLKLISVFEKIQINQIPFLAVESRKYKHKTFQFLFPELLKMAGSIWDYNKLPLGKEMIRCFDITYKNSLFGNRNFRLEIGGNNGTNGDALF
ncbi:MAG: hypothetical protein IPL26_04415 [Leptospiraceae bacterium]|nr:hypothetical protein [Leptospiraceae bacterium]